MSNKDELQASCVYAKRKVSELRAEAERLIATGEMPTLAQVLEAVAEARKKYADQIRAARAEGRENSEQ
jgi:vacuolar-type H+-ATPase subunit H